MEYSKNFRVLAILLVVNIFVIYCKNGSNPTEPAPNTAPSASFSFTPESGTTETVFNFDASGCTDNEDSASALQVRWDWENDGTWDADYSTIKTATNQYASEGVKTIMLEVKDTGELTDTLTCHLSIESNSGTMTDYDGNTYKTVKIGV